MKRTKAKEPVRLRQKKLKNGGTSLYLDYYHKGVRQYEFLRLYLVPEKSPTDKETNRQIMQLAEAIKAQRIVDIERGQRGFDTSKTRIPFTEYITLLMQSKETGTRSLWHSVLLWVTAFEGEGGTMLSDINKRYITDFCKFLDQQPLSESSKMIYLSKIKAALNKAVRDGLIPASPAIGVSPYRKRESVRQYLTLAELRQLAATPTKFDTMRKAFLFSCLCGMRFSDICKMTWQEVDDIGELSRIIFRQKKTKSQEYMDITPQARELLGERGNGKVFELGYHSTVSYQLGQWVRHAGITKHITFHSARHTFAVLMLDLGVDIYTVSKLLGHRELATTQIYAKILDKNKQAAVKKIPDIF